MSEDRIDSIINVPKIEQELKDATSGIKDLVALIKSVKEKSVQVSAAASIAEYRKLRTELDFLTKQTELATKAAVNEAKVREANAKALKEEAKAAEQAGKAKGAESKASLEAAKAKTEEAKATTESVKQKILETKESERQAAARKKEADAADKQAAAAAKAAQKRTEEARPYKQLALAFAAAAKEAQDLAVKYGTMDKRSQAAAKRANELNNELKKIDASIGNHQRNVGNYSSAFDKAGASLKSFTTSFLGLIGIASVGSLFKDSIDEFLEMDQNIRQLQNTLKNVGVPEAFDRISKSADRLAKQFTYLDNDEIIKSFNQLIVYGKLTEQQMNELIPVIIDFAAASGQTLEGATSTVIKALEGNGKALKEYGINMKDAKTTTEAFGLIMTELKPKVDGVAKSFQDSAAGGIATAKQEFKNMKEEIGTGLIPVLNSLLGFLIGVGKGAKILYNDIKDLFRFKPGETNALNADLSAAAHLTDKFSKSLEGLGKDEKLKKVNDELFAINQQLKLAQDYQRIKVDDKGQTYTGMISEKERTSDLNWLNERLKLVTDIKTELSKPAVDASKVLGIGDPNKPFTATKDNSAAEAAKKAADLAERIRKAEFEATKALQEERVKIQEEIFKDESKSFDERIAALREFVQEKARLIELERAFDKGTPGLVAEEIKKIEADKQTDLNELLRTGHTEYNRILSDQKKKEEDIHKATADRIKKIHEDLQSDIEKGLKEADERLKETLAERERIQTEKEGLRSQLVEETEGLIFDVLTAGFDKRKNLIQDEIDALERRSAREIEAAQGNAAAIIEIEARTAAQKAVLEQKQRQIDLQRARFEKAESIANIITKTAEAIISTLAKTPLPAGAPLAFLIGAIGAAQLARVVATPIPRFKEGGTHKGGLMIVGDGGKSEGIELPDGTVLRSPSVPTLMDAPRDTKI